MNGYIGKYAFNCFKRAFLTKKKLRENYENNDIDLTLYTNIKNNIKNNKLKESKIQTLVRTKTEFYYDVGDGKIK